MIISIEIIQEFVIRTLIESNTKGILHSSILANYGYDIDFEKAIMEFKNANKLTVDLRHVQDYAKRQEIENFDLKCKRLFSDALWDLCRKGILRLGPSFIGSTYKQPQLVNEGFSITEYGQDWIQKYKITDLLPADPNRLSIVFEQYQSLFGVNYFKRVKEAVNCFQSGNFLACCVMCGAATESILLSAAFMKHNKEEVLAEYKSKSGRSKLENRLFGKTKSTIRDAYLIYTDLLKYWRDETAHGHDSEIDTNQAFIALLNLLRFATFMKDFWEEITTTI